MQVNATIESVDRSLDSITRSIPQEIIEWLRQRFQSVIQNLLNLKFTDIREDFVVDTNTIINTLLRYAERKKSVLFKLIGNQIFNFHAPTDIANEVTKFILKPNKRVNKNKLVQGWMKLVKVLKIGCIPRIRIKEFSS